MRAAGRCGGLAARGSYLRRALTDTSDLALGDRVRMTARCLGDYVRKPRPARRVGTVMGMSRDGQKVHVLRDGDHYTRTWPRESWEIDR